MLRLLWLELKSCVRRPVWVVLALLSVILFYAASVPSFEPSLTESLTSFPRFPLVSLGEWGRLALLFGGSVVGGIFALFVSLMTVEAFHTELSHRDVLWSTPGAGKLAVAVSKVLTITTFASILIYAGSVSALVNPVNHQALAAPGASYIPLYFALTWFQILVWSAFSLFVFYLTRSRWVAPIVVTVLSVLWYVLGLMGPPASLVGLLHRSYLAWNFTGPFAPLGMIPAMLALQAASYAAVALLLIGGSLLLRGRFAEWRRVRPRSVRIGVALGLLLVVCAVIGGVGILRHQMTPFGLDSLQLDAAGHPIVRSYADRPYIWSRDGVLLFYPGTHGAVRFFASEDPPPWISEVTDGNETRYYEDAGMMTYSRQGAIYSARPQSLVLLFPQASPYPIELESAIRHIWEELTPMLRRAAVWHDVMELFVSPPGTGIDHAVAVTNGLLLSSDEALSYINFDSIAWALTEPTGLEKPERLYLYLYLIAGWDNERVERYLDQLRAVARGNDELVPSTPMGIRPIPRWDVTWGSDMATRIVAHWEKGEMLGHSNYIHSLLKESVDDSS